MGIWCQNDVVLTSMRRDDVASTSIQRHFDTKCPLGGTFTAESENRKQAFEMRCYRRLLNILNKDHVSIEEVRRKIPVTTEEYDERLTQVRKWKVSFFLSMKE